MTYHIKKTRAGHWRVTRDDMMYTIVPTRSEARAIVKQLRMNR